jgi:hypothetical protein
MLANLTTPPDLLMCQWEERAMKYIVEIANLQGETATKEYEGRSISEVVRQVNFELQKYPKLHLVHVTAHEEEPCGRQHSV